MDFSTIVGLLVAFALVVFGMVFGAEGLNFGNITNFIDPQSMAIVIGGTIGALVASFPFSMLAKVGGHFKIVLGMEKHNPMVFIEKISEYALMARKNGLLVLEEKANEETYTFFKDGIMLIVDAVDADKTKERMEADLEAINARHEEQISFYEKGAALAPAFGMIGTLIGLINMLKSMDLSGGSQSSLGQDMSVALVTTLYGSLMANAIFMPIANKMRQRNDDELLCKQIIIQGVLSIQAGENPKYIREKLLSNLSAKQRKKAGDAAPAAEGGE